MKKFLFALAILASTAHAETTWNKISSKPNSDSTIAEVAVMADNMTCTGVNYVKFSNLYNEKTKRHYGFVQAVQFGIYRSKYDVIVISQPGPTTDFIDADTKDVLAKGATEPGKKEVVYPKTLLGDIFNMVCAKELTEQPSKKTDI
jgi:hypothetical protein